ncbi:hypothetical protein AKJ36_00195 [candidate division MSBL1 archaeon SCGC-AAA259I07]|uniref:DUF1697 domain-containing protein n=1 Tax=candidate division MSBL1 archaeon SCGC-AAA259I07 TaxID=1698266 RepID=A0A133UN74_9EURY|nr:hypothetical protein AKJ36_00195 [candidate division MSBL1 archaeon SCGC-AAA259I07]
MTGKDEWSRGVAFVRGMNMFDSARITKNKMRELCEQIEGEDLKVEEIYRTDNILFRKRDMHYAEVGQRLEKVLSEHFDREVHVTCRSMRTVERLIWGGD